MEQLNPSNGEPLISNRKYQQMELKLRKVSLKLDLVYDFINKLFGPTFGKYLKKMDSLDTDEEDSDGDSDYIELVAEKGNNNNKRRFQNYQSSEGQNQTQVQRHHPLKQQGQGHRQRHRQGRLSGTRHEGQDGQEEPFESYVLNGGQDRVYIKRDIPDVDYYEDEDDERRQFTLQVPPPPPNYEEDDEEEEREEEQSGSGGVIRRVSGPGPGPQDYPEGGESNVSRILDGQFFKVVSKTVDGKVEAACQICKKIIRGLIRTNSNFITHLKRVHPPDHESYVLKFRAAQSSYSSSPKQAGGVGGGSGGVARKKPRRESETYRKTVPAILDGTFFKIKEQNGIKIVAECQLCANKDEIKGSINPTSNFVTHLKSVHSEALCRYEEYRDKMKLEKSINKPKSIVSGGQSSTPLSILNSSETPPPPPPSSLENQRLNSDSNSMEMESRGGGGGGRSASDYSMNFISESNAISNPNFED